MCELHIKLCSVERDVQLRKQSFGLTEPHKQTQKRYGQHYRFARPLSFSEFHLTLLVFLCTQLQKCFSAFRRICPYWHSGTSPDIPCGRKPSLVYDNITIPFAELIEQRKPSIGDLEVKRESRRKLIKTGKIILFFWLFSKLRLHYFRWALCMTRCHILSEITAIQSNVDCFAAGGSTVPETILQYSSVPADNTDVTWWQMNRKFANVHKCLFVGEAEKNTEDFIPT